jgi:hypothetical protein
METDYCTLDLFSGESKSKKDSIESLTQTSHKHDRLLKELSTKFTLINDKINSKISKPDASTEI